MGTTPSLVFGRLTSKDTHALRGFMGKGLLFHRKQADENSITLVILNVFSLSEPGECVRVIWQARPSEV